MFTKRLKNSIIEVTEFILFKGGKNMKKTLTIAIVMILIIGMFSGVTNAASASVKASSSTVNKNDTVTITVSFGQKVSAAQFTLNFDSSKLEYVSKTGGGLFSTSTKKYGYTSDDGIVEDLSSVSFKFKAKTTGKTSVSVSGLKISVGSELGATASIGNSSVNITIKEKSTTTTKKPTTTTKKPTTSTTTKNEETVEQEPAPNELIEIDDENVKTLINKKTNIMIKGIEIAIEEGTVLEVNAIKSYDEKYEKLEEILKDITGDKVYFDINLLKDKVKVQPNGYVTVFIPISKYIPNLEDFKADTIKVYYLDEENEKYELIKGKIQELEKEQTDDEDDEEELYYSFTTNHFSKYAVVVQKEEQDTQVVAKPVEQGPMLQQSDFIIKALDFFRDPIVLSVIIGLLLIIVIIQRIRMSMQKD